MYRRIFHDIIKPLHISLPCLHFLDHLHKLIHWCDKIHLQGLECHQHTDSHIFLNYPESSDSQHQKGQYAGQCLRNLGHDKRNACHLLVLQHNLCLLSCPALEKVILKPRCLQGLDKTYAVHCIAVQFSHLHLSLESTIFKGLLSKMKNKEVKSQH